MGGVHPARNPIGERGSPEPNIGPPIFSELVGAIAVSSALLIIMMDFTVHVPYKVQEQRLLADVFPTGHKTTAVMRPCSWHTPSFAR